MHSLRHNLIDGLQTSLTAFAITVFTWTMPAFSPALMGLQIFAPLPAFYYLFRSGWRGSAILVPALFVSGLLTVPAGQSGVFFFTLFLLPAGIALARGAMRHGPMRTGLDALLVLVAGWFLWAIVYGMGQPESAGLYADIVKSLDLSIVELGKALKGAQLGPEQALEIETTLAWLRKLLPTVMPGLLFSTLLNTVFCNMVVGQFLIRRSAANRSPWPPFATWRLPEPLVALIIVAGIGILLPLQLSNDFGWNLLLVAGMLYFFQGLALLTSILNRWSVPLALRVIIFVLVLMQSYGIVTLAIAGLVDVWANFRKSRPKPDPY